MTGSSSASATAVETFDDEFNTLSLWNGTSGTWSTEFIFADPNGNGSSLPGNGEQEWYINNNYAPTASVQPWTVNNGILTITAAPTNPAISQYLGYNQAGLPAMGSYQYTSGLLETSHSFAQTYGYFEMRAELPAGQGLWPAFWLLPANGSWPPELDVMEVLGNAPGTLYTSIHSNETGVETSAGVGTNVANTSTGYHTYAVDWEADYVTYYFDGKAVYQVATPSDMHQPMYMLINLAVGGNWPGDANSTTPLPAQMNVDYVRAYTSMPTDAAAVTAAQAVAMAAQGGVSSASPVLVADTGANVAHNLDALQALAATGALAQITLTDASSSPLSVTAAQATADAAALALIPGQFTVASTATTTPAGPVTASPAGAGVTLTAGATAVTLAGTAGADTFVFPVLPWNAGQVTGFTPGTDKLDLSALFAAANYHGTNPIADGYLSFTSDGTGDTQVYFNSHSASDPWPTLITTLDGVAPTAVSLSDVIWGTAVTTAPTTSSTAGSGSTAVTPSQTYTANDTAGQALVGAAGNDTFYAGHNSVVMTGGTGTDTYVFQALPWNAGQITNFKPGTDKLDLSALFTAANYHGTNPVTDGHLSFTSDGAGDTLVYFNAESTANPWPTLIVKLDGVAPSAVSLGDVVWGSAPAALTAATTVPGETFTATDTTGQVFTGGAGNDTFIVAHSSVTMTGGAGADTFVFQDLPWNADQITDFTPGTDKLDLSALFTAANYHGTNPVTDGYLSFSSDGAGDTDVYFNAHNPADPWPTLVTVLDKVAPSAVSLNDVVWGASTATTATVSTPSTSSSGTATAPTSAQTYTANDTAGQILTGAPGNDTFYAGHNSVIMTGSAGTDTYIFQALPWNAGQITNFKPGTDKLDLSALFTAANYHGTNPVADGYLSFAADGAGDTQVYFHANGANTAIPTLVVTLDHVLPTSVTSTDWIFH